ncbi:uncharacterized protein MELLADRAFT_85868 [Melampsora larici-populina 98AG31]|uniref:Uncharacterized protein n=1 Tax=Melampsora larici-populina (strain 98AG31 / pathotype 3-4-7) TaxID=747676 RepID=F4SDF7_MELLP|nr:uncharacterized protein MELLADRAFT_85868 [Melampsora larici-populina 98AG31]EGF97316.1 hypothetical protein MELLADRAFT_85868 [Melampsora larici-populina 98AG31]
METAEDKIAALRANNDVQIDIEEEEAIKASAAKTTKGNQPLYTAKSSARASQINIATQNTATQESPIVNKTQSSRYTVWEPSEFLQPDDLYDPDANEDDDLPLPGDLVDPIKPLPHIQSVSNSQRKSCRLNPPAICDPIPKDTPRRASVADLTHLLFVIQSLKIHQDALQYCDGDDLNNIQSSLPTQSDFKELNQHHKSSNDNTRIMVQQAADATNTVMGMISSRFGFQMPKDTQKQSVDEDEDPEAVATKKTKQAKQDELNLLKLDRELAQEQKALELDKSGSGMSKLQLGREMVEMIAKLTSATVPHEEAKKMAQEFLQVL